MDRMTPADIDLNASPVRDGRFWVFPSGYRAPVVAGGAEAPLPTFPADLSTLSVEELQGLIDASVAWSDENRSQESTDERLANYRAVTAGYQAVTAEMASRTPTPTLSELADAIVPVTPPAVAAVVAATEPPASDAPAPAGGFSQADLIAAVTAGVQAALPTPTVLEATEVIQASAGELQMPDISRLQPGRVLEVLDRTPAPERGNETITASADIPGVAQGSTLNDFMDIGRAIIARRENIGDVPSDAASEKITVARVFSNLPEERTLHAGEASRSVARKMEALLSHEALTASGGLCVPAQPYYGIMTLAGAARPVRDMLPVLTMERGGVTVLAPPVFTQAGSQSRTVTDGVTNSTTTVTSATAAFDARDVGATISGSGIPGGAFITTINSATSVIISAEATLTAAGVTLTIVRRGAVGTVTAAQDLAALNGTLAQQIAGRKPCLHAACPAPSTVEPTAVSWCLEFGNFTTRAWPEQIPAWLKMTLAVWARTAETLLLDRMSALSTQVTLAPIMGLARDIIPGIIRMAAYLRNRHRIDESLTLRVALPRWILDAAACDLMKGSGYDSAYFTMARAIFAAGLAEANVVPGYYIDSGTGKGQLFSPSGVAGGAQGAGAAVEFPGTVVWYLFPEGSFAFGDGGYLDFGLWRDSALNEANNYRLMAESFEALIGLGPEMIEVTQTIDINGTFAGTAYGSSTVTAPVAIPAAY